MLKEVSSDRGVNNKVYTTVHLMYLPDSSHLPTPAADRLSDYKDVLVRIHACLAAVMVNLILYTVILNQGFHLLTFPTSTW